MRSGASDRGSAVVRALHLDCVSLVSGWSAPDRFLLFCCFFGTVAAVRCPPLLESVAKWKTALARKPAAAVARWRRGFQCLIAEGRRKKTKRGRLFCCDCSDVRPLAETPFVLHVGVPSYGRVFSLAPVAQCTVCLFSPSASLLLPFPMSSRCRAVGGTSFFNDLCSSLLASCRLYPRPASSSADVSVRRVRACSKPCAQQGVKRAGGWGNGTGGDGNGQN